MPRKLEFSMYVNLWPYDAIRTVVQDAERLGFDAIWHQDNIKGHSPIPRDRPLHDVWALLPALAEATCRIRLGTLATPIPRRFAPMLAITAASVDDISGGRLILGLGAGDDHYQYEIIGQHFPKDRNDRLLMFREGIEVIKKLWTEQKVRYDGKFFTLRDATINVRPIQRPHPPIFVACNTSRRAVPHIAAELGDGLVVMWGHDPTVAEVVKSFRQRWNQLGRDPEAMVAARTAFVMFCDDDCNWRREFTVLTGIPLAWERYASDAKVPPGSDSAGFMVGPPDRIAEEISRRTVEMGFNHIIFSPMSFGSVAQDLDTGGLDGWPGNYLGSMRLLAEQVIPRLR
jgi:alkanesulfonate monooxygenase SsuD/methylene tetrahydromethanopterin reductase-like flavin-dependent oxidoreductase (luciferase family)